MSCICFSQTIFLPAISNATVNIDVLYSKYLTSRSDVNAQDGMFKDVDFSRNLPDTTAVREDMIPDALDKKGPYGSAKVKTVCSLRRKDEESRAAANVPSDSLAVGTSSTG